MNQTLNYYNENAAAFCEGTLHADMSHLYGCFLQHVPPGGKILDLGCGSGRDSLSFLRKGYQVEALDGSSELCRMASEFIGKPVRCMDFEDGYTEDTVKTFFTTENGWQFLDLFITGDVREGREGEQWVNGVVRKI